jgi:hypothetical protein
MSNIKVDLEKVVIQREMNGTGSGLGLVVDISIDGVEFVFCCQDWCSVTTGNSMLI